MTRTTVYRFRWLTPEYGLKPSKTRSAALSQGALSHAGYSIPKGMSHSKLVGKAFAIFGTQFVDSMMFRNCRRVACQ
jgi:hypothetical protein